MRWAAGVGAVVATCALGACTSLLGDFDVGDGSIVDATSDVSLDASGDAATDAPKDAPADVAIEAEAGPTCGEIGLVCCGGNTCTTGACCGPKCLDVTADSHNCGACAHDCGGGTCASKQCQPQLLGSIADTQPGRVRLDATNAYFITVNSTHTGAAYSCAKGGCTTPTKLFGNLSYGYDLVLDDANTTAFVSDFNAGKLYACAVGGCSQTPTTAGIGASQYAGLDFRQEIFASADVQPHEFTTTGASDVDLGNGNEGTDWIVAPPGTPYVYWNSGSNHSIRLGKDNTATQSTFWTSTAGENVEQLTANAAKIAWAAQGSTSLAIYACDVSASCASATLLSSSERLGSQTGALGIDPISKDVYWLTTDSSATHVLVRTCPAAGCAGNPTTLASVATTPGKGIPGGVVADALFVFFTLEDAGTVSLYRVAK